MKVVSVTFHAPLDLSIHKSQGLYDPSSEHDACGVGMVTTLNKRPERKIIDDAIEVLVNLNHRGAVGAEENTGDGAGILMSMPDEFMRATAGVELPEAGHYAAGIAFLDRDIATSGQQEQAIASIVREEGLEVLAWRVVPTNPDGLGLQALASMPSFKTLVIADAEGKLAGIELDRKTFRIRKRVEHEVGIYFASLSARTITYKGMLTTMQLTPFFPDLSDSRMKAKIAIVHSRFSTNTFPSWSLAQPFRLLAHNGEINTIQGNRNWLSAREGRLSSELLGEFEPLLPITTPGYSDSGTFDECLELLHLAGRSLPHAISMMLPPAWENNDQLDPDVRAFYEYNNTLIEPWDGPADIIFTDGTQVGALLDRNGFRPGRWQLTDDGYLVLASEAGVLPEIDDKHIVSKGRLEPGKMFLVDTDEGRIIPDEEIKRNLASQHPYRKWVEGNSVEMSDLPQREHVSHSGQSVQRRQRAFDGQHRQGAAGLDGQRQPAAGALQAQPYAVRLLPPEVRAGHQPAAGLGARGDRHLARIRHRPRAEPAGGFRAARQEDPDPAARHQLRRDGAAQAARQGQGARRILLSVRRQGPVSGGRRRQGAGRAP